MRHAGHSIPIRTILVQLSPQIVHA
jgi:hypothetical protein